MSTFDLSGVQAQLLQTLAIVVLGVLVAIGRLVLKKLNISLTDDQKSELEDVASKSLTWGITQSEALIKAKGWDHIAVKNAVVAAAIGYAIEKFPDAMKRSGIDTSNPAAAAEKLSGVMNRVLPNAVAQAADSPATPPATVLVAAAPGQTLDVPSPTIGLRTISAVLGAALLTFALSACSTSTPQASAAGQLFCLIQQAGGGQAVVALVDAQVQAAAPTAAPVAIIATGATKAFVDAACAKASGVPTTPPADPAAAKAVAVVPPSV